MEKPDRFGFTRRQRRKADDAFHLQLGHTITEWAGIEYQMYEWFQRLSTIRSGGIARPIFYSARSFQGRLDMLKAVITTPYRLHREPIENLEFLKAAIKKIHGYSSFRNALAHGLTVQIENSNNVKLDSGDDIHWATIEEVWPDAIGEMPKSILLKHLKAAHHNWYTLRHLLLGVRDPKTANFPVAPQEGLELLARLPRKAHDDKPSPTPMAKTRQPSTSLASSRKRSTRGRRDERIAEALKKGGVPS